MSEEQSTTPEDAEEASPAAVEDVLEGEEAPGVSQDHLTQEEAEEAFQAFLARVEIPEVDGRPVNVIVQPHAVIEGSPYEPTAAQFKAEQQQRREARAEGAAHADLEVSEGLDHPITAETALATLLELLDRLQKAASVLQRTLKAQNSVDTPPDVSEALL